MVRIITCWCLARYTQWVLVPPGGEAGQQPGPVSPEAEVRGLLLVCSYVSYNHFHLFSVTPVAAVYNCNWACRFSVPFVHGFANHCCAMKTDRKPNSSLYLVRHLARVCGHTPCENAHRLHQRPVIALFPLYYHGSCYLPPL